MTDHSISSNIGRRYGISIRSLNIRSLARKIPLLEAEISDHPDVIAVQETWLNNTHSNDDLKIPGYTIVRSDRSGQIGGGVAMYLSDRVGWSIPNIPSIVGIEYMCIDCQVNNLTFRICNIYRPESPISWLDKFNTLLDLVTESKHNLIIVGDLNIDFLNPVASRPLSNLLNRYDLTQHVDLPTRSTDNTSKCIDIFVTKNTNRIRLSSIKLLSPISDHSQIHAHLGLRRKETCIEKTKWLFNNCDYNALNLAIQNENWSMINDPDLTIDQISEAFMAKLNSLFADFIPIKKFYLRPHDMVWMNPNIRREQRKRDRLHKKAKLRNTPQTWSDYRSQRNLVTSLIRKAKREHDSSVFDRLNALDSSDSGWWKIVKSTFGSDRGSIPALEFFDGNEKVFASDNQTKANLLNNIFTAVSDINDDENVFPAQFPRTEARLPDICITSNDVTEIINSLPDNKAPGPDSVNSFVLKRIAESIAPVLCDLFNRSLNDSIFPAIWKFANVAPIYKKGSKSDPNNYRPVSMTSILSKVFEKVVLKYLMPYLLDNNLISKHQSGFIPKHSTANQLIEICDDVTNNLKNHLATTIVFADISRAFDKLSPKGLYCKLNQYGLPVKLRKWIYNFLTNRQQRTCVGGIYSDWRELKGGVAQGSVMGPIAFLLMINDLPDSILNKTHIFADDTSILFSHSPRIDITDIINSDLDRLQHWAETWKLELNPSKTKFMTISFSKDSVIPRPVSKGQLIEHVSCHKHLGVYLNDDMNWQDHLDHVTAQASKRIGVLRSLKFRLSRTSLRTIYISHIRSKLEYCDVVWDGLCDGGQSMALEKLQRDAIRIFTGLTLFCKSEYLYLESGLDTLKERRKQHRLVLLYKILHEPALYKLRNLLPPLMNNPNARHGRHEMTFYLVNNPRIETYKKSFIFLTCSEWNSLSAELRNLSTIDSFKKLIKGPVIGVPHLLEHPRYTSIIYTRLKYKCSSLKSDLYHANITADNICECRLAPETLFHFLYDCPFHDVPREILMFELNELPLTNLSLEVLFSCDENVDSSVIPLVQRSLFRYINATRRFV